MPHYIDADRLKAEIERRRLSNRYIDTDGYESELLDIIDSLQQEQPDKYETALEKAKKWMPNVNQSGHAILIDIFPELGEGLDPRYGGRKQEQPEVDLEKELYTYICSNEYLNTRGDGSLLIARHFYGLRNRALEEAARRVYESWMGGTMDDVRRDMVELGTVLNVRKEE